jgi:hypothetical protein
MPKTLSVASLVLLAAGSCRYPALASPPDIPGFVIIGSSRHTDLTPAILRLFPPWHQTWYDNLKKDSLISILNDQDKRSALIDWLAGILGPGNKASDQISDRMRSVLGPYLPDRVLAVFDIHQIYIYDEQVAIARIKAGERLPFVQYDESTGKLRRAISVPHILSPAASEATDLPLIFIITEAYKSGDEEVSEELGKAAKVYFLSFLETNATVDPILADLIVRPLLSEALPQTPGWFSRGLSDLIGRKFLGMAVGQRMADTYLMKSPLSASSIPTGVDLRLSDWVPSQDLERNNYYAGLSDSIFSDIDGRFGNELWIQTLVSKLEALRAAGAGQVSSETLCGLIQGVTGIDIRPRVFR